MAVPPGPAPPHNDQAPSRPVHDVRAGIERTRMAMNDPHVVALHYRIEHGPDVIDWSRTDPLDKEEPGFRIQTENGRVRFELKQRYPSEKEA